MYDDEDVTPTKMLRMLCEEYGIPWDDVLYVDSTPVRHDNVTTVGMGARSLTFEEEDGSFSCVDGMNAYEAFAAGMCAWAEG
jgi:hypothetical protein